ncbi:MBL fold metallo-hydrolase [Candidatus Bipolaricaulota bacterium]
MPKSFRRYDFGRITCYALSGAKESPTLALADLLLPPDGDEAKRLPAEKTAVLEGAHSCLLVEIADRRILIDGSLNAAVVRASIAEIGLDEPGIDLVLITHGDTDHIAGLVDGQHDLIYQDAGYVVPRGLWDAWVTDGKRGDANPFYSDEQRAIAQALASQIENRVLLLDGDAEIEPGIRAIAAPGHRPSHMAYELTDGEHRLLHVGDALIATILVDQPLRGNAFDSDPEQGIQSRLKLLEQAALPHTLTYVPHFPFPGFARIERHKGRFTYSQPMP